MSNFIHNQVNYWYASREKCFCKAEMSPCFPHKYIIFMQIQYSTFPPGSVRHMWRTVLLSRTLPYFASDYISMFCCSEAVFGLSAAASTRCSEAAVIMWAACQLHLKTGAESTNHLTSRFTWQDADQSLFPDLRAKECCPPLLGQTEVQTPELLWSSWDGRTGHLRSSCEVKPESRNITQVKISTVCRI